jgi:hypothetical protein
VDLRAEQADGFAYAVPAMTRQAPAICARKLERYFMKIVVIGGSGLIGSKVVANLRQIGQVSPNPELLEIPFVCPPLMFSLSLRTTSLQ